jgi:hypothetical protein
MDTKSYNTKIKMVLEPVWYPGHEPYATVQFNDEVIFEGAFSKPQTIEYEAEFVEGEYLFHVIFSNKTDNDTVLEEGLDKAIIVQSLKINGINCDECLLKSMYYPEDRQDMPGHNYISWNGVWTLKIEVPAFEWMHKIKGLGWIFR